MVDIDSLYGAWEDSKSSDEIIKEIRESRVNKTLSTSHSAAKTARKAKPVRE